MLGHASIAIYDGAECIGGARGRGGPCARWRRQMEFGQRKSFRFLNELHVVLEQTTGLLVMCVATGTIRFWLRHDDNSHNFASCFFGCMPSLPTETAATATTAVAAAARETERQQQQLTVWLLRRGRMFDSGVYSVNGLPSLLCD